MSDIHELQVGGGPTRIPKGTVVYEFGAEPCIRTGIQWTPEKSRDTLDGLVVDVLSDVTSSRIVMEVLELLAGSEFDTGRIDSAAPKVLQQTCRLGEAVGKANVSNWRSCRLPSPMTRDSRRPDAIPAGPYLVSLKIEAGGHYLVYGEGKTRKRRVYPPRVRQGQSGRLQQLRDLRTDRAVHHHLTWYLLVRCTGQVRERITATAHQSLANYKRCRSFGSLVQDVHPDVRNLPWAASHLEHNFPAVTRAEVLAMYLPPGHLDPVACSSTSDGGNS